ncbi:MAG: HAMP domain-containing protein [Spirochaetaceae bacterium]|nr:MAG: HAMP domain-containing protein [Spirochaetaceae bacterium]
MNRISIKLASFFLGIVLASTALSFVAVSLLSRQVADEIALYQKELAQAIQELRDKTSLSVDDIATIMSTSTYAVRHVEFVDPDGIDPDDLLSLQEDRIVPLREGRLRGTTTLLRLGESYISIGLHPQQSVLNIMASRLWSSLVLYVVIAAALILVLTNRVVHPVLQLTKATQQVAKGDFAVQIETHRDDEIGQLTSNFNQMVRQLREIEYLRKDFISNVSHEIKTPLASIQGFAKLLQHEGISEAERAEYTGIIAAEAGRLSHLSSAMLRLSKLESLNSIEDQAVFALDEQIRRSIVVLEPQWNLKGLRFNIDLAKTQVSGNEELLQQVWLNLLGNAIKFSPEGERIDVELRRKADSVEVAIRDYGIGIQEEDLPRIFEKFFQVDRAHSGKGSGLGLSLVRRIIELHGGDVGVESGSGKGATFTTTLPAALPATPSV